MKNVKGRSIVIIVGLVCLWHLACCGVYLICYCAVFSVVCMVVPGETSSENEPDGVDWEEWIDDHKDGE